MRTRFEGFPAFQRALLEEVEQRLRSPLLMMEARGGEAGTPDAYLASLEAALAETRRRDLARNYRQAAGMILDRMPNGYPLLFGFCAFAYLIGFAVNHFFAPRYEQIRNF